MVYLDTDSKGNSVMARKSCKFGILIRVLNYFVAHIISLSEGDIV